MDDLLNPAKFHSVHYFWFYHPGHPALKAPADGVGLEASFGTVLPVDWAPPGLGPPNLQSTRGFIVDPSKPSPLGINVVVMPNNGPVDFVNHYKVVDITGQANTPENKAQLRPWFFQPIEGHVIPGQVTFIGLQVWYSTVATAAPGYPPPPSLCLP